MNPEVAAISVRGVARSFGSVVALDGYDVEIPSGRIAALVGPNGAGKTTLLLILAGLLAADRGAVRVLGIDPEADPYEVHRVVGWMPDFFGVYEGLTPQEYLELFAAAYNMPLSERAPRARELLELVDLADFGGRPVHVLSRGQKQRLGFARALVHRLRVLLLDEPASGLDPHARVALRDLVRRQVEAGVSVLISSHILAELEEMAELVAFVDRGRSRGVFPIDALPQSGIVIRWRFRALDLESLGSALRETGASFERDADGSYLVEVGDPVAAAGMLADLVRAGVPLTEAAPERTGLEGAFMAMDKVS